MLQKQLQGWGGAELEAVVGRDHQHGPVINLGLPLQEAIGLRRQAVVKARIRVHLHLEQHYRKFWAAGFGAARGFPRPEHAIEAVAELFELQGLKPVDEITGGGWVEPQRFGGGD